MYFIMSWTSDIYNCKKTGVFSKALQFHGFLIHFSQKTHQQKRHLRWNHAQIPRTFHPTNCALRKPLLRLQSLMYGRHIRELSQQKTHFARSSIQTKAGRWNKHKAYFPVTPVHVKGHQITSPLELTSHIRWCQTVMTFPGTNKFWVQITNFLSNYPSFSLRCLIIERMENT